MYIEGLDIIISHGKAKLTTRSWQLSNPSMWRPGTFQYEMALKNQAKANRILHDLNTTGSYTNSKGLKTTINRGDDILKYGQWSQSAVLGTEAWETQQHIEAAGGLSAPWWGGMADDELLGEMVDDELLDGIMTRLGELIDEASEMAQDIGDDIMEKANRYLDTVAEITSNIAQSIIDIFTD